MAKTKTNLVVKLKEVTLSVNAPSFVGAKPLNKDKIIRKLTKKSKFLNIKPSKEL